MFPDRHLAPSAAHAATATQIFNGGTGTTTAPGYGKVLIGGKSGEYELSATSTLGLQPAVNFATIINPAYVVSTAGNTVYGIKTASNSVLAASSSLDGVLNAIASDVAAAGNGTSIYINPGTYYSNATSTFVGGNPLTGTGWNIQGAGQALTNIVVNNNAAGFFFQGTNKVTMSGIAFFIYNASTAISASSTYGYASLFDSSFSNITVTGTTSLSTGYGFYMIDDDHNSFDNIYMTNIGNCIRSSTDTENKFNPGDATFSNIVCSMGALYGYAQNTFNTGIAYDLDGGATSTIVNVDTFINVGASDPTGTRIAVRFRHATNNIWVSGGLEGFGTTTQLTNGSVNNHFANAYIIGGTNTTPANAYFYTDSTSVNNTFGCTYIASHAQVEPLFIDQNTDANNPNILQGIDGATCRLYGPGTYVFSTTSASIVRNVNGQNVSGYTEVRETGNGIALNFQNGGDQNIQSLGSQLAINNNGTRAVTIDSSGNVGVASSTLSSPFTVGGDLGGASASSTVSLGIIQFDGYNLQKQRTCTFLSGTSWVTIIATCTR